MLGEPIRDRRAERHERTKAEILEAAWDIARAAGLAGLTLRDVAHRVGMRPPSMYSYFDSKNAVYDAMYAQGCREFLDRVTRLALTGDALRDLKTGSRMFVEFCVEDPARYQLMFQRTIPGFEPSAESYALAVQALRTMGSHLAKIGIAAPEALDMVTALTTGLADQQISNDPGGDRWLKLVDEAMEMFFAHMSNRTQGRLG
ncbi:TetR/AcrR family transcriptional regulator [Microtetraspora sp. NBRC 16547]|uniref:TetR/AcrR family transcriptional regulator n=1 Tax=Microtetraspora sp. NBRC 16547 TaxID=3030993 RepID=UPI0025572BDD|nr:TetR/AcrR family transcriptional regulator [Microtetraspora sp. NBRC 16547]